MDTVGVHCRTFAALPLGLRVYWDRPVSVGYGTYFPSNVYGIDYYRLEVSETADFANSVGGVTCTSGQVNAVCHFDRRHALVTGLAKARVYYYRVVAGTVIGYGPNITTVASPVIGFIRPDVE